MPKFITLPNLPWSLKEPLFTWFIVILLLRLLSSFRSVPLIADNLSLINAVILLYVPIGIFVRKRKKVDYLDSNLADFGNSLKIFLVVSVVIFGLAVLVVWVLPLLSFVERNVKAATWFLLTQILMVALPEEFFFRGYLQGAFNEIWIKKWKFLGVSFGPALFFTSLLFALSHSLITFQVWHILIFFPSLVFGWLREKTHAITASLFFHATCNLFSYFVMVKM